MALIFLVLVSLYVVYPSRSPTPVTTIRQSLSDRGYSYAEIQNFEQVLQPDQILELSVKPYRPYALDYYVYPHYAALIEMGYTYTEAALLSTFDNGDLLDIMAIGPIEGILSWLKTPYLVLGRLERYRDYAQSHSTLGLRTIVERINADRDVEPYTHTIPADLDAKILLVNKYHFLSSSYVPAPLIAAQGCGDPILSQEAAEAYTLMCQAITKAGLYMNDATAYRSYSFQASLYQSYLKSYGQSYTDTIAARPGFSEHQTGLAIDLNTGDPRFSIFVTTKTYLWVSQHCAEYGFILRYPQGKEAVTGYRFESWHYRYVGVDLAQDIVAKGLTLDEYALLFP